MSLRKLFISKRLIIILLLVPLIIDILNGVTKGSGGTEEGYIGVIYRGMILLLSIKYYSHSLYNKWIYRILGLSIIMFIYHFFIGGLSTMIFSQFFKAIYGYSVLVILLGNKKCHDENAVCTAGILYGWGAAVSIIISALLGIGYTTYVEGTFGTKGLFIALNDISLTMIIMNALSLYMYQKTRNNLYFIASLTIAGGCAFVGSMASYFGTLLVFFAYFISIFIIKFSDCKSTKKQKLFLIALILFFGVFILHKIITIIIEDPYLSSKYADVTSNLIELSGRSSLIDAGFKHFQNQSVLNWLLGNGYLFSYAVGVNGGYGNVPKGVEVDIIDFIGNYGILITCFLLWYPVKYLFICLKRFTRRKMLMYYWILVSSLIFWGLSFYSGHAFASPMSMTFYIITFYLIERDNVFRRKISNRYYKEIL